MYFLVFTGNQVDIKGYDLQRSYYPIHSLCPRECTEKYRPRDSIDNAAAMMQSGSLLIYPRQAKCQHNGCKGKSIPKHYKKKLDRNSFDAKQMEHPSIWTVWKTEDSFVSTVQASALWGRSFKFKMKNTSHINPSLLMLRDMDVHCLESGCIGEYIPPLGSVQIQYHV